MSGHKHTTQKAEWLKCCLVSLWYNITDGFGSNSWWWHKNDTQTVELPNLLLLPNGFVLMQNDPLRWLTVEGVKYSHSDCDLVLITAFMFVLIFLLFPVSLSKVRTVLEVSKYHILYGRFFDIMTHLVVCCVFMMESVFMWCKLNRTKGIFSSLRCFKVDWQTMIPVPPDAVCTSDHVSQEATALRTHHLDNELTL